MRMLLRLLVPSASLRFAISLASVTLLAPVVAAAAERASSQPATTQASQEPGAPIDVATFKRMVTEGGDKVVVLDVRTPREYGNGRIAGAVHIDYLNPDFKQRVAALDRGKTYLVYCLSGERSLRACKFMHSKLRFPAANLYNLEGGIADWRQAGEPVEE